MHIEACPDPTVSFEPRPSASFSPIEVPIPRIRNSAEEKSFANQVEDRVREACGSTACVGSVSLVSTNHPPFNGDDWIVQTATIRCESDKCPLIDPGEAGDREPRLPAPPSPAMASELSIPGR